MNKKNFDMQLFEGLHFTYFKIKYTYQLLQKLEKMLDWQMIGS